MDNICEQLVTKSKDGSDRAKAALIIAGMALLCAGLLYLAFWGFILGLFFALGVVAGGVYLLSGLEVEYEYIITNNELDIDKIIGRRKRKRMITVDLSLAEDFCAYPAENMPDANAMVYASTGLEKDASFLYAGHKDYGKVGVIFNPNKKTREAIAQELPNALRARLKDDVK